MNVPDYRLVDFSIYFCGSIDIFSVTIPDKRRSFEKSRAEINIFNISISSKLLLISIPSGSMEERRTANQRVVGSIPTGGDYF